MSSPLPAVNQATFVKMAHGDVVGLRELATEFFEDTRQKVEGWRRLSEAGAYNLLWEELHCCKGGASIFGLERLLALIVRYEAPMVLENEGFNLEEFMAELAAAEEAVRAMAV